MMNMFIVVEEPQIGANWANGNVLWTIVQVGK
jgi:hypothetical protein